MYFIDTVDLRIVSRGPFLSTSGQSHVPMPWEQSTAALIGCIVPPNVMDSQAYAKVSEAYHKLRGTKTYLVPFQRLHRRRATAPNNDHGLYAFPDDVHLQSHVPISRLAIITIRTSRMTYQFVANHCGEEKAET